MSMKGGRRHTIVARTAFMSVFLTFRRASPLYNTESSPCCWEGNNKTSQYKGQVSLWTVGVFNGRDLFKKREAYLSNESHSEKILLESDHARRRRVEMSDIRGSDTTFDSIRWASIYPRSHWSISISLKCRRNITKSDLKKMCVKAFNFNFYFIYLVLLHELQR